jgi:hypothetical protein
MARTILLLVTLVVTSGCASFRVGSPTGPTRSALWEDANEALGRFDFAGAQALFEQLAESYPETVEGRESLFYLGAIHLDPRNADWDPQPAQEHLSSYLAFQGEGGPRLYRYLEAQTLHEIARQLNLPAESRVEGLQPEQRVVTERVVVPAQQSRELTAEVARLREQVAERDARIQSQQEELERIRRTLAAPSRQ